MSPDAVPEAGWIAPELREEFPGLALRYLLVEQGSGRSPRELKARLAQMSNRFSGPQAVALRHFAGRRSRPDAVPRYGDWR